MSTSRIGIYSAPYLWTTIGACALVFLNAFENLAVTTIMPIVSDDLDGARLYALAFAAPLAVGVIGMVIAGNWSDRAGPTGPLYLSGALFVVGLLVAGTAQEMWVLVLGRLVQGLGGGGITVALYVVVARIYPVELHQKIFAAFAAAWVVPSMIGPAIAGFVAQILSWHWVFLGVVGLVLAAVVMVVPAVRMLSAQPAPENPQPWAFGRIGWAILAAGAVLALNLSEQAPDAVAPVIAVGALVLLVVAVRPLVPRGTLTARRGLASVVLSRSLVAAAFFGAEVYIPYLLIDEYAFDPALAGVALTGAAVSWAAGSWLQGRLGARLKDVSAMRIGALMLLVAVVVAFTTAALHLAPWIIIAGWVVGGGGMGLMYPRMSAMTLARSTPESQGFNSSAITIADSLGAALALATTGLIVAALVGIGGAASFAGVFALTVVIAVTAVAIAGRVEEPVAR